MNEYWQNLRPFEKRFVVVAAAVLFLVLNALMVWPHFSDLAQVRRRNEDARAKLELFKQVIAQRPKFEVLVRNLESEGLAVPPEEQAFQFNNAINAQAGQSGVQILSNGRLNTSTNQFFIEKSQNISLQAGESQLVDFLYNLGSGNSLIRVRDLDLRPEPNRHQLVANVKLVASYQKKTTSRGTPGRSAPGSSRAVAVDATTAQISQTKRQ